jgi:hypothetical protein
MNRLLNGVMKMPSSKSVIEALDKNGEALDSICDAIKTLHGSTCCCGGIKYPQLRNGPIEQVLAFNNNELIKLEGYPDNPHFSSHGVLTDLCHRDLKGSRVLTTFPVKTSQFEGAVKWPPPQKTPYNQPPVDNKNTTDQGSSKQAYSFDGGVNLLVTVGPSLPKITPLAGGGAQFWVGSIGVIAEGKGIYEGVRGMSVYLGSAYFSEWPEKPEDQIKKLAEEFEARVTTYFKFVPKSPVPA